MRSSLHEMTVRAGAEAQAPSSLPPARARRRLAAGALAAGMAWGGAGCGQAPPASRFPTADDALARMRAQFQCVNGLQATAKVDVFSKRGRVKGEAFLFAVNPARVRFDIVSGFGVTVYTLTSDGARFEMMDLEQKQFLHGPASACNLARMTQVPMEGHVLVSVLRGEAPVLVHDRAAASIAWNGDGFYEVELSGKHDATERVHLGVHPDDMAKPWGQQRVRVLDVSVAQRGTELWHVELDDHAPAKTAPPREDPDGIDPPIPPIGAPCDAELPRSIRMEVPHTADDVILDYTEAVWNPPMAPGTFDQPVPRGVRRVPVDCR